uniref:Bcl-2-related ovarian killer B n=1 Tax=Aceria tosichella TaxID=561515 RepID=A0A6G1S5D1_9ACAR
MNNLTVDHNNSRLSKPRKSVIGRLERSSFQAQRLSDVGIAFSQQITAKVGLKLPASQERIVEQTRWLYLRYVFVKLRQNKLPLKDLNLTKSSRSRRAAAINSAYEAQIVVSISEPPTADALTLSDQRPLFTRQSSTITTRQRTVSSANINAHDLNLLAARMSSARRQHLLTAPTNLMTDDAIGSVGPNVDYKTDSSTAQRLEQQKQKFEIKVANGIINSAATNNRKYVMDPTINNQILTVIMNMINELRESKPEFYGDTIYEVIGLDKFSSLDGLLDVQRTICQEMTRTDISWDRIAALFSLFGAMSLDCVRLGAPEHVGPILDGFIGFVERDLAYWISQQGGWESFLYKFRAGYQFGPVYKAAIVALPILLALLFVYN